MKDQKMTGGKPKGSSIRTSTSNSNRKTRWESGNNLQSGQNSGAVGESKSTKPSSNPKDGAASGPSPRPSKVSNDPSLPSGSSPFIPPGPGDSLSDPSGMGPPPPPAYGFHMLERRTIVLADGSVRSYFALPPDYQDFQPPGHPFDASERLFTLGHRGHGPDQSGLALGKRFPLAGPLSPDGFRRDRDEIYGNGGQSDYWNSLGLDGRGPLRPEGSLKRKYGDEDGREENDEFARQRQQLLQYGNPISMSSSGDRTAYLGGTSSPFRRDLMESGRGLDDLRSSKQMRIGGDYDNIPSRRIIPGDNEDIKHRDVDPHALKKAFLRYVKLINENSSQRMKYLEDGKNGPLQCLACGRSSKDFPDMHGLVMHAFNSQSADIRVDHLGLHKALCVLMGWNFMKSPDNSKAYQSLSADEAMANRDDLIMWPPLVIVHNTNSGRGKEGRMEGMGNKAMDSRLRDLGFSGGKSKSLYGKDGHLGITLVKFAGDQSGLKEAIRLAEYFEKDNLGRRGWARAQSLMSGRDDESSPYLFKMDEKTGEKKRIFYGYLGTASDLDKVDVEIRKKAAIESRKDFMASS